MEADSRLRLRAHYTPQECAEMLPRWQSVLESCGDADCPASHEVV